MEKIQKPNRKKNNKKIVLWTSLLVAGMFLFGYALVPLYNVLCKTLGIGGKTNTTSIKNTSQVDQSRTITVEFITTNNEELAWNFYPLKKSIEVHPGENNKVAFFAENKTDHTMTIQAMP